MSSRFAYYLFIGAKHLGLALPPKTPMGAYAEFFRELYPKIRENYVKDNGKIDSHAVARFVGAKWVELSESEKKVSPQHHTT